MGKTMTESSIALSLEIGERLRAIRQTRGLSQQKVATALGITFQQLQKYERGTNRISVPTLILMSVFKSCGIGFRLAFSASRALYAAYCRTRRH